MPSVEQCQRLCCGPQNPRSYPEFSPPICRAEKYFAQLGTLADQLESPAIIVKSKGMQGRQGPHGIERIADMTVTISRLYGNYADAQRAITSLEAAGVPHSDLSIIANNSDNWYGAEKKVDRTEEGAATGAGIGAGLGGAAGLLAGLGVLANSGPGPRGCSWMASVHHARSYGRRRNGHHRWRFN